MIKVDYTGVKRPMTKEDKAKWLDALRSGKFNQGNSQLSSEVHDEHCCLGVANIVCGLGIDSTKGLLYFGSQELEFDIGSKDNMICFLPAYDGNDVQQRFTGLNDYEKKSFSEIADYIEKNIPAVDEC